MQNGSWRKAAILTAVVAIIAIGSWEIYLRSQDVKVEYDNGKELWADKRAMVYEPSDKATVFIGSSRNKFDLDIPTWYSLTGDHAIQLAMEGESPVAVLDDLAADKNFKGKLVVDVTEGLFFSIRPDSRTVPEEYITYYKKLTPAEKFSFVLNRQLESKFVFLDRYNYSINGMLDKLEIPSRKGVFMMPIFPMEFGRVTFDRQTKMTDRFVADTNLQNKVKKIWQFFASLGGPPPISGAVLDSFLLTIKKDVDAIQGRGGKVIFLRTPSSGPYREGEKQGFPREIYWKKLLEVTGCPGIHFEDYPAIANFQCPEWSHLSPADAKIFTTNLAKIIETEKGWTFPHKPTNP